VALARFMRATALEERLLRAACTITVTAYGLRPSGAPEGYVANVVVTVAENLSGPARGSSRAVGITPLRAG
jgi:hypothetical protein